MDPIVAWVARLALALLFAASAGHKLRAPAHFRQVVRDYQLGPRALAPAVAFAVPAGEVVAAVALVAGGGATGVGVVLAVSLLGLYSAAIGANLARGRRTIDCGCAGPARRQPIGGWMVARNTLLLVAALLALPGGDAREIHWLDLVTVGGAVGALACAYRAIEHLGANLPSVARARGIA